MGPQTVYFRGGGLRRHREFSTNTFERNALYRQTENVFQLRIVTYTHAQFDKLWFKTVNITCNNMARGAQRRLSECVRMLSKYKLPLLTAQTLQ